VIVIDSRRTARRKVADKLFTVFCFMAAMIAVLALGGLVYKIVTDGLGRVDWNFMSAFPSNTFPEKAGIWPAIVGTLYIVGLTGAITVPVGVLAAVYLEEFANKKSRLANLIEVNITNLSGVPSIVYGMLGLAVFSTIFGLGKGLIVGALTMSILILPMVILVSREALRAVPESFRQGSLALGATQWQTIWKVVIPRALPGILTGIILSLSRAMGETAPLIVVGAVGLVNFLPESLDDAYMVLPLQIFDWSQRPQEEFHTAAAGAIVVLMAMLLALNSVAIVIRARAQKKQG